MKPQKKALNLTPLEKMVQFHKPSCTMHLYHMKDERRCSCGRDDAIKQLRFMLFLIASLKVTA